MTSEIRANTIKNRVGLGTVSFTNTGAIVSGIVTATGADINGDLDVDGHTNLDNISIAGVTTTSGLLDINAGGRANTFKVEDLTNNRVVIAGTGGELEDSANLTYDGSKLTLAANSTAYDAFQIGNGLFIGNTTNNVSAAIFHQGGGADLEIGSQDMITFTTGSTAGNATERLRIDSNGNFGFGGVTPGGAPANKNVFLAIGDSDSGIVQDGDGNIEIFGNAVEVANFNAIDGYTSAKNITTTARVTASDLIVTGTGVVGDFKSTNNNYVLGLAGNNSSVKAYVGTDSSANFLIATGSGVDERIRITSGGNVIIGDTGTGNAHANGDDLIIGNTNSGKRTGLTLVSANDQDGQILFSDGTSSGNANISGQIVYNHSNDQLSIYCSAVRKVRITSGGLVESAATFGIANVGGLIGGSGGTENWIGIKDTGSNFKFVVKTASASSNNLGKVGINNTNPQFPLHLVNTSSTFNQAALIKCDNSTSGQGSYATFTNTTDSNKSAYFGLDGNGMFNIDPGAALIGTSGTEPIILATNGSTERFRIQASTTATVLVQQSSGADVFSVSSDTAETTTQNSLTYVNYGLAIGKQRTDNNTTHGTSTVYTPYYHGEGEKVFGIDPSWSLSELRRFFGSDNVEWFAEEAAPGGYCIKVTGNPSYGGAYNSGFPYIPIDDDDQFFQEMWIRVDSGTSVNHYAGSIQYDKNFQNPTGNPGSFGYELMVNTTTNSTSWSRKTATLGPNHGSAYGQFRSGFTGGKRKYVTPQALFNYQHNSGARVCYISGWSWYRRRSRGNTHFASISADSNKGFRIPHPLTSKRDKYDLFHNALEGPKMDLIYRGKVNLVGGSSIVNLDTANEMTEGTFVLLNHNVQCFTSNESGWTPVKGSVSGNILTITAQDNTSTDTIAWMVVGERHDDCAKESEFTDDTGKLIVELRKDQQYVGLSTTPMIAPGMKS